ncbi:MAG TPA: hypothetical protein VNA26_09535 [Chitinophagaceae bacterium]|nr:hypothetical protein [Chitinophagaceae bacterium]
MEYNDLPDSINPEAINSLKLPYEFDRNIQETALEIDDFLKDNETSDAALYDKVKVHREAGLSHLFSHHGKHTIDIKKFSWPSFLYIPKNANARDYWISPAPDSHRYGLEWTSPVNSANTASIENGTLFSFSQLDNGKANAAQSSESGIGIFYEPSMSLGVIDLQPTVSCTGSLRTFLEFFPKLAAGYVEVKAQLLLACWQQIPGSFDLLGFKSFDVATSGRRDQTFGPELRQFQNSFEGLSLSAPFVVQRGRRYLLGIISRINVISTLVSNDGRPLPPISNTLLRVWGSMNCIIPQINVFIKRVDIP